MKAIKCELCGSNDLKKIDGEYICQYCKTKYTLEEAKKLMVELAGPVKIDTTDQQNNLEKLADRAYEDKLYDQALGYYNRLLELDSDNYKYIYKKGFCAAYDKINDVAKVDEAIKGCKNAIKVIEENNIQVEKEELYKIADELDNISVDFYTNKGKRTENLSWDELELLIECEEYALYIIEHYLDKTEENESGLYKAVLKNLVLFYAGICKSRYEKTPNGKTKTIYYSKNRDEIIQKYDECVAKIKEIESNYYPPYIARKTHNSTNNKIFLWIVGWIICPLIPISVLIGKSKMNTGLKVFLIIITWFLGLGIYAGLAGGGSSSNNVINNTTLNSTIESAETVENA